MLARWDRFFNIIYRFKTFLLFCESWNIHHLALILCSVQTLIFKKKKKKACKCKNLCFIHARFNPYSWFTESFSVLLFFIFVCLNICENICELPCTSFSQSIYVHEKLYAEIKENASIYYSVFLFAWINCLFLLKTSVTFDTHGHNFTDGHILGWDKKKLN